MKKLLITSAVILSVAGTISYMATKPSPTSATDEPPIVQTVNKHDQELNNHEARISNAENNIQELQSNTDTPPSDRNVEPPTVDTTAPAPEQPVADNKVTVTESTQRIEDGTKEYCDLTYSDGTTDSKFMGEHFDLSNPNPPIADRCGQYIGQEKAN